MAFVPAKEIDDGGHGVPVPLYLLTYKGVVLRTASKARDVFEWLAHPYHQGPHYACAVVIDGVEREVHRNG